MRIAVWKTGHHIADTVATAIAEGLNGEIKNIGNPVDSDIHLAYGILRGTEEVFRHAEKHGKPWFNIDRGYTNPGHFDGNYRISHKGTQLKWHEGIPRKPVDIKLEPWRVNKANYSVAMICGPTKAVASFFGISIDEWLNNAVNAAKAAGLMPFIRYKDSQTPLESELRRVDLVITFNSSVGWQALQMGIPVLSDVNHSAVGSFYGCADLPTLVENLQNNPDNRIELFEAMEAHQFKLSDTSGIWKLLSHYLSQYTSATMVERPSLRM